MINEKDQQEWGTLPYYQHYAWMNRELSKQFIRLVLHLKGEPTFRKKNREVHEWWYGEMFWVSIEGRYKGMFFDDGMYGGALDFVWYTLGYYGKDMNDWVRDFLGYPRLENVEIKEQKWTPIMPIQDGAYVEFLHDFHSEISQPKGNKMIDHTFYTNQRGDRVGIEAKFQTEEGEISKTLLYCHDEEWNERWRFQDLPDNWKDLPDNSKFISNFRFG